MNRGCGLFWFPVGLRLEICWGVRASGMSRGRFFFSGKVTETLGVIMFWFWEGRIVAEGQQFDYLGCWAFPDYPLPLLKLFSAGYVLVLRILLSRKFSRFYLQKGLPMLSFIVPSETKMVRKLYFVKAGYHLSLQFNPNIFMTTFLWLLLNYNIIFNC